MTKQWKLTDLQLADWNRDISESHVEKLMDIIEKDGYQKACPIVVNAKGEIIDGQHRFAAVRRLYTERSVDVQKDVPIVEIEDEKMVMTLNTSQLAWGLKDYVHYYAEKGLPDYIVILKLARSFDLGVSVILALVMGTTFKGRNGTHNPVKDGELQLPLGYSHEAMTAYEERINNVFNIIRESGLPRSERLVLALTRLEPVKGFSYDVLLNKIMLQRSRVFRCSTIDEYMNMLINLYNWKNKKPIVV